MKLSSKQNKKRFLFIDILRGIAISLMILYHFFFDLSFLDIYNLPIVNTTTWNFFRDLIASMFLLLVGTSLYISFHKYKKASDHKIIYKYLKRGFIICSWGFILTLISYLFISPTHYIQFGILHLIGISILLSIPLFIFTKHNVLEHNNVLSIGIFVLIFGSIINQINCNSFFIALGCSPANFASLDYFPVLPWFGIVLIGYWLAPHILPKTKEKPHTSNTFKLLSLMGRHSLGIYLVHQPIIWGILYLIKIKLGQ